MSLISRAVSLATTRPAQDLAKLDPVGDFDDSVEHTQASVADVVDDGIRADLQIGGDPAGRGRLEVLAADPAVDQGPNLLGKNVRYLKRTPGRQGGSLGKPVSFFPPPPLDDAREGFQLSGTQVKSLVDRLEPSLQFGRRHHHRRDLVTKCFEKNLRILHRPRAAPGSSVSRAGVPRESSRRVKSFI